MVRDQLKDLYDAYEHNQWTQTVAGEGLCWGEGAGWERMGGGKETHVIHLTIKNLKTNKKKNPINYMGL